jgi:uncharacterized membrane protein
MALAETPEGTPSNIIQLPTNERGTRHINIGETERLLSLAAGIPVTILGLTRGIPKGLVPALFGTALLYRGVTGHSFAYHALGLSTVEQSPAAVAALPDNRGIQVKRAVTINASPQELYTRWHDFQNAPQYMQHVESVQPAGNRRWHWVAKVPLLGTVAWEAEVTNDEPGRLIAWNKTQGSFLAPTGGSVRFEQKSDRPETVVQLKIDYLQFRGPIGSALGNILGQIPEQEAREDLRHFKELAEAGELPTTQGQPSGRRK